jgi:hypothetical protein
MAGTKFLDADGIVGVSGHPVRIYNVVILSAAGGAGVLVLRNGTTATDTVYVQEDGTDALKSKIFEYEGGLVFPGGCFFDIDTNVTSAVFTYDQIDS